MEAVMLVEMGSPNPTSAGGGTFRSSGECTRMGSGVVKPEEHFPDKLNLNWRGPYKVVEVFDNGSVQLANMNDEMMGTRVNGHRVKKYIT
ncbi:hypothetical protein R1flu_019502 [Riccia fluitans]|uniref:Uncharacterized protein n=1 Tax=Riccia fluitans TaxID=41844 RepID=A0ABD1ZIU5_9MARC